MPAGAVRMPEGFWEKRQMAGKIIRILRSRKKHHPFKIIFL